MGSSVLSWLTLALVAAPQPASKSGLTIDDMLSFRRISEPTVSPDGRWVAFSVRETDFDKNRGRTDIWMASTDGSPGESNRMTTHAENDTSPAFSPDGKWIYFLSSRKDNNTQVFRMRTGGGEAEQVTHFPVEVNGFRIFPDGDRLLLAMDVYVDAKSLDETKKRDDDAEKDPVKARAYDELMFRHWDSWEDKKRSHLFVWSQSKKDAPIDVMNGMDADAPTRPFGDMTETAISPDGRTVAFSAKDVGRTAAWSTNVDIFIVPSNGARPRESITRANAATDTSPVFSPDGKRIAYLKMARAGYESDRTRIAVYDLDSKKHRVVTEAWDRSPQSLSWLSDGRGFVVDADNLGHHSLFLVDETSGTAKVLVDKGWNTSPIVAGRHIIFLRDSLTSPAEVHAMDLNGSGQRAVSSLNATRVSQIAWGEVLPFEFLGANDDTVHGFAVRPARAASGKVPIAYLVHGGPQGSMGDHFHYRWNPQVFAGRGYGVVFIDFHGSTGYGQAFTDAIRNDWGGAPFTDLMRGLDAAVKKFPWLDSNRAVALGASFGGYMINWINANTTRFLALVCHDGNLDERFAYFDTEELWFPEWEHGLPWQDPTAYARHNPIERVMHMRTPTLVIHGGLDFRVVDTQGMATFTALQRLGVPSRFLHFPNENHWVLKPQNSKRWHDEVFAWIDRFTKNSAAQDSMSKR